MVHGPTPHTYEQRTPKKMKAAALRQALSDRARNGRVHVVSGLVGGDVPSTRAAAAALRSISSAKHVLVVAGRDDLLSWKSLRNVLEAHVIDPGQLNTYDVLVSDDVVFTQDALEQFVQARGQGAELVVTERTGGATTAPATAPTPSLTKAAPAEEPVETPATDDEEDNT